VDALIVLHESNDVLKAPASALFREKSDWAVFVVNDGVAQLRKVKIGHNNGLEATILEGVQAEDRVILYPASNLVDGMAVIQR
jgi:HlyD family secretion protein